MNIIVDIADDIPQWSEEKIVELALFALEYNEVPDDVEVSISLVDDEEIASLNETYRDKTGPTDVLSFPLDSPWEVPDDSEEIILGDIMIATNVAQRQSLEYGTSFDEEMSLLLVHGILHLLEYDHIEDDEAKVMEDLEKEILLAWSAKSDA